MVPLLSAEFNNVLIFQCNSSKIICYIKGSKDVEIEMIKKGNGKVKKKKILANDVFKYISMWDGWDVINADEIMDNFLNVQIGTKLSKIFRAIRIIKKRKQLILCPVCGKIVKKVNTFVFHLDEYTTVKKQICYECQRKIYEQIDD